MTDATDALFTSSRVMAIFRNMEPAHATMLAHRAWNLGIELVEVPIQTPDALPTLKAVVAAGLERGKRVGSGTVLRLSNLQPAARLVRRLQWHRGSIERLWPNLRVSVFLIYRE